MDGPFQGPAVRRRPVEKARQSGVSAIQTVVQEGDPAQTILQVARERHADMIVMGSRGLGDVGGFLLGSVSHKVSSLAECTCIIIK